VWCSYVTWYLVVLVSIPAPMSTAEDEDGQIQFTNMVLKEQTCFFRIIQRTPQWQVLQKELCTFLLCCISYEGESVNRPQMDIKHETWYSNLEKTFISQHILHQHWYTCPIVLPAHPNLQHRSLLTAVSAISPPTFQPLLHQKCVCHQGGCLADQTDGSH
jgi:hypothetical protein